MLKKLILLFIFSEIALGVSYGQSQRICSTVEYDNYLRAVNPAYAKERDEMKIKMADYSATHKYERNSAATLIIPVVVHVLWNTAEQNISDEQIMSEIDALNEDYSITNANIAEVPSVWAGLVGSSHLYFSIARRDDNGMPASGIIRKQTSAPSFAVGADMKYDSTGGSTAWNRDHYLNIWVCNLENGSSQDVLGFAQFPSFSNADIDGIVIHYRAFGRTGNNLKPQYNLGRTATHEIGHWLNLEHIWGANSDCNDDDHIGDTPRQESSTYGCPSLPHVSCNNGPDGDMFMNYMDYTDDKCMMLFTTDQRSRMDQAIQAYRFKLEEADSSVLPVTPLATDIRIANIDSPAGVVCSKTILPVILVQNNGSNTVTGFTVNYRLDEDTLLLQYDWNGTLNPNTEVKINLPSMLISDDLHTFIASVTNVNGGSDDYAADNFKTRSFLYAPGKYSCPENPETPEISILPNPAGESISIELKYKEAQKATLSIYNVLGKRVYTIDYLDSQGEFLDVYVSGLANGIYVVEVKTFNKQASQKLVINHN